MGLPIRTGLTFVGDPVPDTDSRSHFHFRHHCGVGDFRRFIAFLIQSPTLGEMTDADKIMNPQHLWNDPAGTQIRILINPEIRIQMQVDVRCLGDSGGLRSLHTV